MWPGHFENTAQVLKISRRSRNYSSESHKTEILICELPNTIYLRSNSGIRAHSGRFKEEINGKQIYQLRAAD